jgi:hypothetical protein
MTLEREEGRATHRVKLQVLHFQRVASTMLASGKATPKIGDRVDELTGNIQKKLYGGEGVNV